MSYPWDCSSHGHIVDAVSYVGTADGFLVVRCIMCGVNVDEVDSGSHEERFGGSGEQSFGDSL